MRIRTGKIDRSVAAAKRMVSIKNHPLYVARQNTQKWTKDTPLPPLFIPHSLNSLSST